MNNKITLIMIAFSASVIAVVPACASSAVTGSDSLAIGMKALESNDPAMALELTASPLPNSWLEIYRLFLRSEASLAFADTAYSASSALTAIKLIGSSEAEGHPVMVRLINLAVQCCGPDAVVHMINTGQVELLETRSILALALYNLEIDDTASATSYISQVSRMSAGSESMDLLRRLALTGFLEREGVSAEEIAGLVGSAIGAGEMETAGILIGIIRVSKDKPWLAEILEADIMAASGKQSKALEAYRAVFRSDIFPVSGKRTALYRLASLQYKMRKYRDSSGSYRTYGLYYPDDHLAELALDRSARIEVAEGRIDKAIMTWNSIAEAGPVTYRGLEAVLSMAVLLERMGDEKKARLLLEENLEKTKGRLRNAYLYWIIRACSDESSGSHYNSMLLEDESTSFYAKTLKEGDGFLTLAGDRRASLSVGELEEKGREEILARQRNHDIDSLFYHPSLEAFRLFAGHGSKKRAAECARGYIDSAYSAGTGNEIIGGIYAEAKAFGMENFCLDMLVSRYRMSGVGDDLDLRLYPIAFGADVDVCAESRNIPPVLVLAIIREESRFDENALSPAGAIGLMQLMPATGEWIGGKIGRKDVSEELLRKPDFNIAAGCWYIRFLLDRGDESIVAALAAYNAGHGKMRSWKSRNKPRRDPIAAIELIGPTETRRYVRRVLDSMTAYQSVIEAIKDDALRQ